MQIPHSHLSSVFGYKDTTSGNKGIDVNVFYEDSSYSYDQQGQRICCSLVISFLPESMGSQGILLVPAILFHFFQLLNCSFITVKWTPKEGEKEPEGKKEMKVTVEEPHVIPSKLAPTENDHFNVC